MGKEQLGLTTRLHFGHSLKGNKKMFGKIVSALLFCSFVQIGTANYRTCKCDIRVEDEANAQQLVWWSHKLWSCGIFCDEDDYPLISAPGIHVSCDEVRVWCPKKCKKTAFDKINANNIADFDSMCTRYGKASPLNGIHLYAYSKVMNNCGGSWDHFNLNTKLCCMYLRRRGRWIGWVLNDSTKNCND